jgi:hypothetical protein
VEASGDRIQSNFFHSLSLNVVANEQGLYSTTEREINSFSGSDRETDFTPQFFILNRNAFQINFTYLSLDHFEFVSGLQLMINSLFDCGLGCTAKRAIVFFSPETLVSLILAL